jgi:hypothetical protein
VVRQDVMSVNIFILFLDHAGTVWFDDLFLAATTTIGAATIFVLLYAALR